MATKLRTQEIVALFQKYIKYDDKSFINGLSLKEIQDADIDLGWRDKDASYKLAMKQRIEELKQENIDWINEQKQKSQDRKTESRHVQNLWLTTLGIVVAIVIAVITWLYFS